MRELHSFWGGGHELALQSSGGSFVQSSAQERERKMGREATMHQRLPQNVTREGGGKLGGGGGHGRVRVKNGR